MHLIFASGSNIFTGDVVDVNTGKWLVLSWQDNSSAQTSRPIFAVFLEMMRTQPHNEGLLLQDPLPEALVVQDRSKFKIHVPPHDSASVLMKPDTSPLAALRGIEHEMWTPLGVDTLMLPYIVTTRLPAVRPLPLDYQ